jgi:type VI secretion system protein ImpH
LVADYFGVPAGIGQFISQWLVLEPDSQTRFVTGGNTQLGVSALAGERFWDAQSKFRVRLGPLGYADFAQFLPAGESHAELADLARLYSGPTFDVEVQLVLRGAEAPWCQLGGDGADAARLGWNTWIRNTEFTADVSDAIFALESGPLGTTPPTSPSGESHAKLATKTKPPPRTARGRG